MLNSKREITINIEDFKDITFWNEERIRDEIIKALSKEKPSDFFRRLNEIGVLEKILPDLHKGVNFNQFNPYHYLDVFEHTMFVVDNSKNEVKIRLAALLHDIGKPVCNQWKDETTKDRLMFIGHEEKSAEIAKEIMQKLKFGAELTESVYNIVKIHDAKINGKAAIKETIGKIGIEDTESLFWLKIADIKGHAPPIEDKLKQMDITFGLFYEILEKREPYLEEHLAINREDIKKECKIPNEDEICSFVPRLLKVVISNPELNKREILFEIVRDWQLANIKKSLEINGTDIMDNCNIQEGKEVGGLLNKLAEAVLDNFDLNEKKALLKRARDLLGK